MDFHELEKQVNELDVIKIQKLVSWLSHKEVAIACHIFSDVTSKNLMDNTSKEGRKIIEEEMQNYEENFEQYLPEVYVTMKKYIELIMTGKGIEYIDKE